MVSEVSAHHCMVKVIEWSRFHHSYQDIEYLWLYSASFSYLHPLHMTNGMKGIWRLLSKELPGCILMHTESLRSLVDMRHTVLPGSHCSLLSTTMSLKIWISPRIWHVCLFLLNIITLLQDYVEVLFTLKFCLLIFH